MPASEPAAPELSAFIRSCVERGGGLVDEQGPGRLDALLPPELQAAAGGPPLVNLTLDSAAGEEGVPATLGSPFVDGLIQFATARGRVASGYLPGGRLKRKGLREEVERTLRFSNCRTHYLDAEADVRLGAIAQFDFKVAFLSEERRERCYVVPVNLVSGHAAPALGARLTGLTIAAEPDRELPREPVVPIETAYQTARMAVRELILDEARRQQVRVGRRFAVEAGRISEYYDHMIRELERRRDRERRRTVAARADGRAAPAEGEPMDERAHAEAHAQKIEATRLERERKLRELGESYRIRARAQLASARCLWQPKVYFKVLLDRGPLTRSLTLAYDGLLECLELPACESCRQPTSRLRATSAAKLQCPACAGEDSRAEPG